MRYVEVDTPNFEIFSLHTEVVLKLTFLGKEICVVAVIEAQPVFSQRSQCLGFSPVDVSM
jgi:hypothetical protein